jgi:Lon protease-like protein
MQWQVKAAGERELLDLVAGAASRVKLFPLPEATLFPNQGLPLHVFEPRYRQLMRDALEADRVVGIPQLRPGFTPEDYAASPALYPLLGVGVITQHQDLPDGRYNVIIRGVARARLLTELPALTSYRIARVELLAEEPGGDRQDLGAPLAACLLEIGRRLSPETAAALGRLAALHDPGRLADLTAAALLSPEYHQRVLGELNVARRIRFVTDRVAELLLSTKSDPGQLLN